MSFSPYRPRPPVEPIRDHEPLVWIESACADTRWAHVEHILPPVFEAYARVLHPFDDETDAPARVRAEHGEGQRVRWSTIAARNCRAAHRLMQVPQISTPSGEPIPEPLSFNEHAQGLPQVGTLPVPERIVLTEILGPCSSTPDDCFFGVWDGFGDTDAPEAPSDAYLHIPGRAFVVFRGPIDGVHGFPRDQSPNVWWPSDRAWFVASEIDLSSTYVGGSQRCIDQILSDARLEALPARPDDPVSWDADTINV